MKPKKSQDKDIPTGWFVSRKADRKLTKKGFGGKKKKAKKKAKGR